MYQRGNKLPLLYSHFHLKTTIFHQQLLKNIDICNKEPAKPPRRRSKDPNTSSSPRPVSSREVTPVNNPTVGSRSIRGQYPGHVITPDQSGNPVRPSRLRAKNRTADEHHNGRKNINENNRKNINQRKYNTGAADVKLNRPTSLQEAESVYEILTPVARTQHSMRPRNYCSSSDSESDFRTPQARVNVQLKLKISLFEPKTANLFESLLVGNLNLIWNLFHEFSSFCQ